MLVGIPSRVMMVKSTLSRIGTSLSTYLSTSILEYKTLNLHLSNKRCGREEGNLGTCKAAAAAHRQVGTNPAVYRVDYEDQS